MQDQPTSPPGSSKNVDVSEEIDYEGSDQESSNGPALESEEANAPPDKVVKPLTAEALAAFRAAEERTGVIYISRIPPGMRPAKVRHLMTAYGEVGRVYLQQEGMSS